MPRLEEYGLGAEASGGAQGHGGVDAVAPRLVAGGANHAALVRLAADNHRQAAQLGALEQLDGNKERVHIHVQDGSGKLCGVAGRGAFRRFFLCPETGELRHR